MMLEVVLGSGGPTALTRIFDPSRLPALRPSRLMSAEGSVWVEGGCAGSTFTSARAANSLIFQHMRISLTATTDGEATVLG